VREISPRNWELRDQVYNLLHRWPAICGAVVLGAIFGYILSLIWPAHYRASSQVYLGLNAYRRYSDTIFEALANPKYSNLDNYQYWQMSQLDAALFLDRFLDPTIEKLRQEDNYWEIVQIDDLRDMLSSEWRTTGTWSLIADHSNPERADQAVKAWSTTAIEQIRLAVDASRKMILIDHKLRVGETELLQARLRIESLNSKLEELNDWLVSTSNNNFNIPPDPDSRWKVYSLISSAADYSPSWMALLGHMPGEDSPLKEFVQWVEETKATIDVEIKDLDREILGLEKLIAEQANAYALESKTSLSFSPNIEIERIEDSSVKIVRPTTTFILMGSLIGLLSMMLYQLSLISKRRRDQ
jgi:hypothetical protein